MYRSDASYFSLIPAKRKIPIFLIVMNTVVFIASVILGIISALLSSNFLVPIIIMITTVINIFNHFAQMASYMMTTPEGIEYHSFGIVIFSTWENLEGISLTSGVTILKLNSKVKTIPPIVETLNWYPKDIPLYLFSEGPDSPLMQEIHKYRPDIKG